MSELAIQDNQPSTRAITVGSAGVAMGSIGEVGRMAQMLMRSGMVPSGWPKNVEGVTIAILAGVEAGLTYTQTVRGIMVVNNRPSLWGDVALAMCRRSELCGGIKEWTDGTTAYCECIRRGDPHPVRRSFSVDEAKKAGLWGKTGPWSSYPNRMLQMRARAFALRDAFPDCLGGLSIAEELMDYSDAPPPKNRSITIDSLPDPPADTNSSPSPTTDPATAAKPDASGGGPASEPPDAGNGADFGDIADKMQGTLLPTAPDPAKTRKK